MLFNRSHTDTNCPCITRSTHSVNYRVNATSKRINSFWHNGWFNRSFTCNESPHIFS